jgi:2-polyprenyl-3-methyl-5-hydroxy-6-metoxy-1,4-benzoquinol methylase
MHYNIKNHKIYSEYAAKPVKQASKYVKSLLEEIGPFDNALDYGCGKLRYASALYHLSQRLTVTDSKQQLDRVQTVINEKTTVREYVEQHWYDTRPLDLDQLSNDCELFDFVLCANVLSAIPNPKTRIDVLKIISTKMSNGGIALILTQYTNSYFCQQLRNPDVIRYRDGFLLGTKTRASFYGLINLEKLKKYVESAGMLCIRSWRNNQSAFVLASKLR